MKKDFSCRSFSCLFPGLRLCLPGICLRETPHQSIRPGRMRGLKGQRPRLLSQGRSLRGAALASRTAACRPDLEQSRVSGKTRSQPGLRFQSHLSAGSSRFSVSLAPGNLELGRSFHCVRARAFLAGRAEIFLDGSGLLIGLQSHGWSGEDLLHPLPKAIITSD